MADAVLADPVAAPPLSPADGPIDFAHLSRMTLGERALEREVLRLFDQQAGLLLARMQDAAPAAIAALAHTLKGSASGIGAFAVAHAAGTVERAAEAGDTARLAAELRRLAAETGAVRQAIGAMLRAH